MPIAHSQRPDPQPSNDGGPHTVCARLTPTGRGAVAVVGLFGEKASELLDVNFRPANGRLPSQQKRNLVYGLWLKSAEDLIVIRLAEQHFEVHCHGGNSASQAIIDSLVAGGATHLPAASFQVTLTADPWRTSAELALSCTTTGNTARIALRQLDLLPTTITAIVKELIACDKPDAAKLEHVRQRLSAIAAWSDFGLHLTEPRSVVFCGKPNVGKSSLVNAIVGFQRAIVHQTPGTTRDIVSQTTAIAGWPVTLKDTAGIRNDAEKIEAVGIEKAKREIAAADVRICVFDQNSPWSREDQTLLEEIAPELIVFNKADLKPAPPAERHSRPVGILTAVPPAIESQQGVASLIERLGELLVDAVPPADQAIPLTIGQVAAIDQAIALLSRNAPFNAVSANADSANAGQSSIDSKCVGEAIDSLGEIARATANCLRTLEVEPTLNSRHK